MHLFKEWYPISVLSFDGEVLYFGSILDHPQANEYYVLLEKTIAWENDRTCVRGRILETKRQVAWYGDADYAYTYSGYTHHSLPWTDELLRIKHLVEGFCNQSYNSCLLNYYKNGETGMSWHSDNEKALGENTVIASLSLGAERKFVFRHKEDKKKVSLKLEHGSLLVMKGSTQTFWQHCLPKSKLIKQGRINLTFRTFKE